ncbi:MAG: hypothetical protein IPM24_27375 [Bryobacterales bacterium]|nr:hypothetical protein [Bryobacterales bacterium]
MLTAILISTDPALGSVLEELAVLTGQVSFRQHFEKFPSRYELARVLNSYQPELVFVDLGRWEAAIELTGWVRQHDTKIAVVGFGDRLARQFGAQYADAGLAAVLAVPFEYQEFLQAVDDAIHKVRAKVQPNLLAFLPSKAGSGCTTTVLNVAARLAGEVGQRVLVLEADLHSGILPDLLHARDTCFMRDALEHAAQIDSPSWRRYTVSREGFDAILADRAKKAPLPTWIDYYHLLGFAASRYDTILVDLPEVVNDATVEIVRRARQVFVVCTPEIPSLALARQRLAELALRGAALSRAAIVVNRWHASDLSPVEVSEGLGRPVAAVIHNDYRTIQRAILESRPVHSDTRLGRAYLDFARQLAGEAPAAPETGKFSLRRLLLGSTA